MSGCYLDVGTDIENDVARRGASRGIYALGSRQPSYDALKVWRELAQRLDEDVVASWERVVECRSSLCYADVEYRGRRETKSLEAFERSAKRGRA
jgi:hypothetical protein